MGRKTKGAKAAVMRPQYQQQTVPSRRPRRDNRRDVHVSLDRLKASVNAGELKEDADELWSYDLYE